MTAPRSALCRGWTLSASPTSAPRVRRWRPAFASAGPILPGDLIEPFAEAKLLNDRGSPILDQLTFADFLTRGEFDRHLRRMRPIYRARRDALLAALTEHLPELEPAGIAAGLHLVAWLPDDLGEAAMIEAAANEGVAVAGGRPLPAGARRGAAGSSSGTRTFSERAIADGIARLGRAVAGLRRAAPGVTAGAAAGVRQAPSTVLSRDGLREL